jgi:ferredoxin--NADP+ reductase
LRQVVVIGAGNVAIDVARVLAKTPDEMAKSDIVPQAAAAIAQLDIAEIAMVARRGPADANFTGNELAELGRLAAFRPVVDADVVEEATTPDSDPAPERMRKNRNLEILRGFAAAGAPDTRRSLRFDFWQTPVVLHGEDGRVRALEVADTRHPERRWQMPADLVVTCIGYGPTPPPGLPLERGSIVHADGRVRGLPAVYVVGWAKRGPTGVIPTNRVDALGLVKTIVADLAEAPVSGKPGPSGLDSMLAARGIKPFDTAAWQRIEAAENAAGQAQGRPRVKFGTWNALTERSPA